MSFHTRHFGPLQPTHQTHMGYDDIMVHKAILQDHVRTAAFEAAIHQTVRSHHRVLDFGCGTGILSFFAARAGARAVFAMDKSPVIRLARKLADRNGFENIRFLYGDENEIELPERVDVIVSEWMGHFGLSEGMLEPLLNARNRYLKPGGIMLPGRISFRAGLVCDEDIYLDRSFFNGKPYGLDFSPAKDWPFHHTAFVNLEPRQILPAIAELGTLDLLTSENPPLELTGTAVVEHAATIFALCGWFQVQLTGDIELSTGPADPQTHWQQLLFPLSEPVSIAKGQEICIRITPLRNDESGQLHWQWSATTEQQSVNMDSFVHTAWIRQELPKGELR